MTSRRKVRPSGLAKLMPPVLPRVIERTRLFRQLDSATKAPLTWIAAPPGAGKTTLLASYLQKRAHRVIWYRLDSGDTDPSTLFHYLSLVVQTAAPRFRRRLPHLTPEYMAGLPIFTQRFFEQLGTRFRHPIMIVFDNYHEMPQESLVHQLLPVGIQQLPRHVRLIVLSRERLPATYTRLQVEQQLSTIDATELELTREEARQVSRLQKAPLQNKGVLSNVDQLWEATKGWMAGFILLLEHQGRGPSRISELSTPQAVFEYLAGEVMDRFPPATQKVLLTMSILSDFTSQMAQALSLEPNTANILEQLHQSRYFIERREERIGWYRFHPLFQEFLRQRTEQTMDRTVLRDLRRQAAALLVESQREDDAVTLLQQARAWEDYRAIVRGQASILVEQGRLQTLEAWIAQLPGEQREIDPWMDFWLANGRIFRAPHEAYKMYELAIERFRQHRDQAGMLLALAGAVQSILVAWTGMRRIHHLVRLFDEIHPTGTSYPSLEVEAVVAQAMAGAYVQMYPDRPKVREWLDRSVEIAYALPPSLRVSAIMTAIYYIWMSDSKKAFTVFADQQKLWADDASVSMRVMMAATEATLSWWAGRVEHCRDAVRKGLDLAEREGLLVWNGILYSQAAANELMIGNIASAREFLNRMRPISEAMGGIHYSHYLGMELWADLMEEVYDTVGEKIWLCQEIMKREDSPLMAVIHTMFEAQYVYRNGQIDEARRLLDTVESVGRAIPSKQLLIGVFVLRAERAFDDGDEQAGEAFLREAVAYAQQTTLMGFIGWQPASMARLLAKALEMKIEVPYVHHVIRERQLKPPADGSAPENWPWRVKIRTFGKLAVEVDGKPIEKHRKAPHRLLELLAAIIAFGGHDVPVSRLIDALWPDADGDTAHENFKKSLARLRKLLAVDDVIQWQDGKLSLNRNLCWVDALVFEKQAKQDDARAIAVYKGPFLGSGDIPAWAVSPRDRMRARFISLVKQRDNLQADADQSKNAALAPQETVTRTLESKSTVRSNG